jgi:hypothetical protein
MKKHVLLTLIILTACLLLTSCDMEDLLAGTIPDHESASETEFYDQSPWFPLDTGADTGVDTDSEAETDGFVEMPVIPDEWEGIEEPFFNLTDSYTQDEYLFIRIEHLTVSDPHAAFPAVLRISDLAAWNRFCDLRKWDEDFFSTHALLVLVTEGNSGSIRYRVDGVAAAEGMLHVQLTAQIPSAVTMDIVHWCVVIPVAKESADLPVRVESATERME